MEIATIKDKNKLNEFVGAQRHSRFLQSWEWGEFQQAVGNKIMRLGAADSEQLVAAATLIKKPLPLGKGYFYCPRGPVVENRKLEISNLLFDYIYKLARRENVIFLRIEPEQEKFRQISNFKFQISKTLDIQPSKTLILDLSKTEEKLLANMHQKTRYNICLAEKKGVKVYEAGSDKFAEFWQLMRETVNRDGFRLHGKEYYKKMLSSKYQINSKFKLIVRLFLAEYKNKVIAANIISFFGDTATYMHGASSSEHRNVMAPYLLQWQVIKLARETGYKYYDFFGIDEIKWPGVTRFKKGFGGEEVEYPGTFDFVHNKPWHAIYKFARKARKFI